MKRSSLVLRFAPPAAALCVLAAAVLSGSSPVQARQQPQAAASAAQTPQPGMRRERNFPPPTNLKVLPKDLTGAQVREIMRGWAGDLGQECSTCHAAYPNRVGPNGRPVLDYASDEKPEKQMARIMYTMTQTDKAEYIKKVEALDTMGSPAPPLTCGTCHRGNLDPQEYVAPRRGREGMPPAGTPPPSGAEPPAGPPSGN